jgi:ketosteroid isomerase-like protein
MPLEEMLKDVQALEDLEAIKNLHSEYIFYLRNRQFKEMIDCFADDAVLEIRDFSARVGKAEIAQLFTDHIPNESNIPRGNSLVQPVITVEGDTAKGHWLLYHFRCDYNKIPGKDYLSEWQQGYYDCEYVRVNGTWKFGRLKFISPWPQH